LSAKGDFAKDLQNIVTLRNNVAHVRDSIRSDADLKAFVERIETAEEWLEMSKSGEVVPAVAG